MKVLFNVIAVCFASIAIAQNSGCPSGEALIGDSCGKCPPGQALQTKFPPNYCYDCSMGTFKAEAGNGPCIGCPANSSSLEKAKECTFCPPGQALMKNGKCGSCPPGTRYEIGSFECYDCEASTFQPYQNVQESCFECSGDTYSYARATKCTKCPENQALMRNGRCRSCPPGTHYFLGGCFKCRVNEFQPYENVSENCFPCAEDTNSLKGATKCTKCKRNEALMRDGTCGSCPKGTGYDRETLRCKRCGFNEYSTGKGVEQHCGFCPLGFYANKGATECFQCPEGLVLIVRNPKKSKGKCGFCPPGSYTHYSGHCYEF